MIPQSGPFLPSPGRGRSYIKTPCHLPLVPSHIQGSNKPGIQLRIQITYPKKRMRSPDWYLQSWRIHVAASRIPPTARVLDSNCHHGRLFKAIHDAIRLRARIDPLAVPRPTGPHTVTPIRLGYPFLSPTCHSA
jgi:hypothetical protein